MKLPGLFQNPVRLTVKALLVAVAVAGVLVLGVAVKGWTLPLALVGIGQRTGPVDESPDWCGEHGVPERLCTLCDPALKETLLWCAAHDLPEELCTLCHADLAGRFEVCPDHGLPTAFCQRCGATPGTATADAATPDLQLVRLASRKIAEDAGIEVVATGPSVLTDTVIGNGAVRYNQNRYTQVRPRVEGIVLKVLVDVGVAVHRGDVLARVDSSQLGRAKADYLAALALVELAEKNVARLKGLAAKGITAEKDLFEAETHLREDQVNVARSRQALLTLGVSHEEIDRLATSGAPDSVLEITAPQDGVVVERLAVEGEAVQPTTHLFSVADLATMWLVVDVNECDWLRVAPGQSVSFRAPALPSLEFAGTLTWISPEMNPRTHTVQARVELENDRGLLRANMFGKATIEVSSPHESLLVPKSAVQTHKGVQLVFVKKSDTVFEPRPVRVRQRGGPMWEIESGIQSGDEVVTTGSFLFKTELERGAIGSGCCAN